MIFIDKNGTLGIELLMGTKLRLQFQSLIRKNVFLDKRLVINKYKKLLVN